MNPTEDKGKHIFCGGNPVGQGLPERAGYSFKKGLSTGRLVLLVKTKLITTFFGNDNYWSSTENSNNSNNAWYVNFNNGNVNNNGNKNNNTYRVRPLLAFLSNL